MPARTLKSELLNSPVAHRKSLSLCANNFLFLKNSGDIVARTRLLQFRPDRVRSSKGADWWLIFYHSGKTFRP